MKPAVALVPGFLGFDHKSSYSYFGDRLVAGLRAALEEELDERIPVVPTSTLPIASLADRQARLLHDLRKLEVGDDKHAGLGPRAWHVIGHSTGGVDAAMLLRSSPLVNGEQGSVLWDKPFADEDLVERVMSATSISAPHDGTALAECAVARFVQGRATTSEKIDAVKETLAAFSGVLFRDDLESRLGFATGSLPPIADGPAFVKNLLFNNALARDLRPAVTTPLSASPVRPGREQRMFSVVTVAPTPTADSKDHLFVHLWKLVADAAATTLPAPRASEPPLTNVDLRLPSQREARFPVIDERQNDGVVTSTRQCAGETIAVVLADHADVIGRYRRYSLADDLVIDPGLLTSGADFGDDTFFEMIRRIARRLAPVIGSV
jgi:hypothetical protein